MAILDRLPLALAAAAAALLTVRFLTAITAPPRCGEPGCPVQFRLLPAAPARVWLWLQRQTGYMWECPAGLHRRPARLHCDAHLGCGACTAALFGRPVLGVDTSIYTPATAPTPRPAWQTALAEQHEHLQALLTPLATATGRAFYRPRRAAHGYQPRHLASPYQPRHLAGVSFAGAAA